MTPTINPPDRRLRLLVSLIVGALAVALTIYKHRALPGWRTTDASGTASDFDQVRFAALVMLQGKDPYALIGPGRAFDWHWPFFYPLSATIPALPFVPLSALAARCLFIGGSAFALALGLTRRAWHPLVVLLSPWGFYAIHVGQFTPAFTAGLAFAPGVGAGFALGALTAIKPTIGAAMLAAVPWRDDRGRSGGRTFVVALAVVLVTFAMSWIVRPGWVHTWLETARGHTHFQPIVALPGGALALLALLRWRRPEARMLAALACVPQTFWWYDAVPLALVPASRTESLIFALAGWGAYAMYMHLMPVAPSPEQAFKMAGRLTVLCAYVPCVTMVIRRPNVGSVPCWLDRAASSLTQAWYRSRGNEFQ